MKPKLISSLLTVMIAFVPAVLAQTPSPPSNRAPTAPVQGDKNQQSNKGGELHGLDRADQMGGEHGQQGRDTARDAQLNRPDRFERPAPPDRPARTDRPGR